MFAEECFEGAGAARGYALIWINRLLVFVCYDFLFAKYLSNLHHEETSYATAKWRSLLSQLGQGAAG
jgi:hypothetical protein